MDVDCSKGGGKPEVRKIVRRDFSGRVNKSHFSEYELILLFLLLLLFCDLQNENNCSGIIGL